MSGSTLRGALYAVGGIFAAGGAMLGLAGCRTAAAWVAGWGLILIVGLAIGAHLLAMPPKWIGVGALCLIGIAIIHGVTATRQKDASS